MKNVSLNYLLPLQTDAFFRYNGSLTTPSCNEIVFWTVFQTPVFVSEKQVLYIMYFYLFIYITE